MNKENELTEDELEVFNHQILLKEQQLLRLYQNSEDLMYKLELAIYKNQVTEYLLNLRKSHEK